MAFKNTQPSFECECARMETFRFRMALQSLVCVCKSLIFVVDEPRQRSWICMWWIQERFMFWIKCDMLLMRHVSSVNVPIWRGFFFFFLWSVIRVERFGVCIFFFFFLKKHKMIWIILNLFSAIHSALHTVYEQQLWIDFFFFINFSSDVFVWISFSKYWTLCSKAFHSLNFPIFFFSRFTLLWRLWCKNHSLGSKGNLLSNKNDED